MPSATHAPFGTPFSRNRFLQIISAFYAVAWGVAAISPLDRPTWLLENLLVFGVVALLVATHRIFVFSRLSYALLFVFMLLHVAGSHYTYSQVPLGAWVDETFGVGRNHYDRVVHFSFGLLFAYPLREYAIRVMHVHRSWSYVIPILAIMALSALYEMIESWAARIVDPEVGLAFLGAQGDVWDGQKDMTLALVGSLVAMTVTALWIGTRGREPYSGFK
jgi:putative membrane protein